MAVSVVQHRSNWTVNVTSFALAFASNNTAGNLLVYCDGGDQVDTLTASTDSNSNTIANANSTSTASGGAARIDYAANCNSGANTVTAHHSASTGPTHLHIWEISGCISSSPLRDTGTVASSSTASVSTSGSTSQSGDAVIGFFNDFPNNDTLTAGSGFSPSELTNDTTLGDAAFSEFKAATANGTQTATCSGNGTNVLQQIIVVFKQAVAGSAFDIPQLGMMGVGF